MGDLAPGASMLELDPTPITEIIQPEQKTLAEQLDALTTTITPTAESPSWGDRWKAKQATRGSDNPVNPVMDWLSGTDWSQARGRDERPILANLGPKALTALSFISPQIGMLNRAINFGQAVKKDPKEATLGLLGGFLGSKYGGTAQNIFNTARNIRSNKSTFKQGIGNLFMGELLGRMGKNRDVGQGILSMLSGEKGPGRAFSDFAIGRAGRQMNPMQQQLFRAGIETKRGRPMGEAFGSAFKGMAGKAFQNKLYQRAFQKGGRPLVRKLQAAMQFMPSPVPGRG